MGASATKQYPNKTPTHGSKIMAILNPELQNKLQPYTDYIIEPSPQQLKNCMGEINATVFSTLDYSIRKEVLPVSQNHFGAKIKVSKINDCSLRVTKVFPNSPCERLGISTEEYIVGLSEAQFINLSTFAQVLHKVISAKKEVFSLAICSQVGITRLVPVSTTMLSEWRSASQGILGCELAEGWMHRFKGRPKRGVPNTIPSQPESKQQIEAKVKLQQKEITKIHDLQAEQGSQQWDQIERKVGGQAIGESLQVNFKGLLKNQYLEDASTICRCKLYNKHCQRCWIEREGGFHFFNKKTNRIITIPQSLLLKVPE